VSTNGETESSGAKLSASGTIFIVNREMFPTKYDDFDGEVLDQIVTELKFQLAACRRAMPSAHSIASTTIVDLPDVVERHRMSQVDSRISSKPKFGLAPPSTNSRGSVSGESSPRNITTPAKTSESDSTVPELLANTSGSTTGEEYSAQNLVVVVEPVAASEIVAPTT